MNVFDIIGPVMIGPSSSHTAGAVRLGRAARKILNEEPAEASIYLSGSFAQTYRGHGTDKALLAGILGMDPQDERIRQSPELAKKAGLCYSFHPTEIPGSHPNTARICLVGKKGAALEITGSSVGGGNIFVEKVNGMEVMFTGQYHTILVCHYDKPGTIASVTNCIAYSLINIGNFRLSRPQKGGKAIMTIEVDGKPSDFLLEQLRMLPNVVSVVYLEQI